MRDYRWNASGNAIGGEELPPGKVHPADYLVIQKHGDWLRSLNQLDNRTALRFACGREPAVMSITTTGRLGERAGNIHLDSFESFVQ